MAVRAIGSLGKPVLSLPPECQGVWDISLSLPGRRYPAYSPPPPGAAFADFIHNFNYLRVVHGDTGGRAGYLVNFDARLADGLHIVGSPDTVKKRVQEHLQITGSHYFVGSFVFDTLTSAQTLRSMYLFAEVVMPACRRTGSPGMA